MARPFKPYQNPKLGIGPVAGLARDTDGRWRVVATGKKFSEPDEFRAVDRFYALTGRATATAFMPLARGSALEVIDAAGRLKAEALSDLAVIEHDENGGDHSIGWNISEEAAWEWVREQVAQDVEYAARQIGCSPKALARSVDDNAATRLPVLFDAYKRRATNDQVAPKTIAKTESAWSDFCRITGAASTDGLTTSVILRFRDWINAQAKWGAKSRSLIMQRVKAVVNAAAEEGISVGTLE